MPSVSSPASSTRTASKTGVFLAWGALVLGVACAATVLLAALGYRNGGIGLGPAIQSIRWAGTGALAGAVVAVLGLLVARRPASARPKTVLLCMAALVLNALVAAPPLYLYLQAKNLPLIHDISTDTHNPPAFVAIALLRSSAPNPVEYDPANAAEQLRGYPDIAPLVLPRTPPAQSFARAERAARALGWSVASTAAHEGRLEATDRTPLMGFEDDIVVRIRAIEDGKGSVVDVRSVSRVGLSDIGTNAGRIRAFLRRMQSPGNGR